MQYDGLQPQASQISHPPCVLNLTRLRRWIQFANLLAYTSSVVLFVGCIGYHFLSEPERHNKRYDTQVGPYRIERKWRPAPSYLMAMSAAAISVMAAIAAFYSTLEVCPPPLSPP